VPLLFLVTEIASSKSLESSPSMVIIRSFLKSVLPFKSDAVTSFGTSSTSFKTSLGNSSGRLAFLIIDSS
jgi:hypothetical protein